MMWTLEQIAEIARGRWVVAPGPGAMAPVGAAIDSREVGYGMLFAAFAGGRVDGHRYLGDVQGRHAAMALATDEGAVRQGLRMPVLLVDDASAALERLASWWRDAMDGLRVVGVTGSNGKTTTCRLLHAAACSGGAGALPGSRTRKSFNNELGVPLTLLNVRPGDRVLSCEIGMSTPGEVAARCRTARPDAAIVTTVSEAHLAGLGSLEAIAREKASIAAGLREGGVLFMPAGLEALERAVAGLERRPRVVRVGDERSSDADHRVAGVESVGGRTRFTLDGAAFEVPMPGAHNAMNGALAVLAARWLGVPDEAIARGLLETEAPRMRLERVVIPVDPPIVVINDAYNANPSSMRAAIDVLAAEPGVRRVAVLGDMLELGDASERAHREIIRHAETQGFDEVITVGACFAGAGGAGHAERETDAEAIARVAARIAPGDVVLLKGSRGIRLERVVAALEGRFGVSAGKTPAGRGVAG